MPSRKYPRQDLRETAEKHEEPGQVGPNDEIGTLTRMPLRRHCPETEISA